MKTLAVYLALSMMLILTSCDQGVYTKGVQGAGMGAAGGTVIGQIIGRNHQGTLIGAAVGGLLGYIVGNEMDKYDRQRLNNVYEHGASGHATSWKNPDSGNSYRVTPHTAYTEVSRPDRPCRRAEIDAVIDGKRKKTYSTACRDGNGQWILKS